MAAVRGAARRLGGSLLQRAPAAVTSPAAAEERRRLFFPRLVHTQRTHAHSPSFVQQALAKQKMLAEIEYVRANEMRMLDDMAYKSPSPTTSPGSGNAATTVSIDNRIRNYGVVAGAVSLVGGFGWLVYSSN